MAKRITIVNFKGGVGKTTLALHLGCFLARRSGDARVLLVDVDHQSTLSIVVMDSATTADAWETAARTGETVNKVFAHYTTQGAPMPGAEIVIRNPFGRRYPNLDLAPAQLELDDTEIDLAATTIGNPFVSEWRKRTLLCRWLESSGVDQAYDFIVFDCPPATKLVSQNAIAASHAYAIPVIPDAVSTRGVTHFRSLIANRIDARLKGYAASVPPTDIPPTYVPDTQLGGIVISMAQTHGPSSTGFINEHWEHMQALRRRWGTEVLENVIERGAGVAEALGDGWPTYDQRGNVNVANRNLDRMFEKVCGELLLRLGW